MTEEQDAIQILRAALIGLVGVSSHNELEQLEAVMRMMPMPEADRIATLNAIHALLSTEEFGV